ncbi:divergent polysaccharide deacetylase family protein [Aureimonas sp. AU20]|uniref:divergent polysaccharide deacetylase family protein n=1 Tax=Aureimonas sp. AU20 TaxID=1349819 RepID=UPI0007821D72|nr:divergent polysaccharide deacetylase family protein [Aureimonas sp. AU20]
MREELYRPLGLELTAGNRAAANGRLWPRLRMAALGATVLAGSAATFLFQPDFQPPPAAPVAVAALPEAKEAPKPAGPSIVRPSAGGGVTIANGDGIIRQTNDLDGLETGSVRVLEPGSLRQPASFAHLPEEALLENSAFGPLPVRAGDGRRPLDVYSGTPAQTGGTRVAIVVGGLGISQTGTQKAVQILPPGVTLAFAAAGNSLDRWMQAARRNGHELLLQAPMEPFGYPQVSPGEHTQTVADAANGQFDQLHWAMGRLTNYVGVMNFMGARFNADPAALEPFLAELSRRGLLYLDDGTSPRSASRDVAVAGGTPFAASDLVLDDDRSPEAIRRQLDTLERIARAKGTAIGVASAFEGSVLSIAQWAAEASARGVEIVPVSALASDPEAKS